MPRTKVFTSVSLLCLRHLWLLQHREQPGRWECACMLGGKGRDRLLEECQSIECFHCWWGKHLALGKNISDKSWNMSRSQPPYSCYLYSHLERKNPQHSTSCWRENRKAKKLARGRGEHLSVCDLRYQMDCVVCSGSGDGYVKFCLSLMHAEMEEGKASIIEGEQSQPKKKWGRIWKHCRLRNSC